MLGFHYLHGSGIACAARVLREDGSLELTMLLRSVSSTTTIGCLMARPFVSGKRVKKAG